MRRRCGPGWSRAPRSRASARRSTSARASSVAVGAGGRADRAGGWRAADLARGGPCLRRGPPRYGAPARAGGRRRAQGRQSARRRQPSKGRPCPPRASAHSPARSRPARPAPGPSARRDRGPAEALDPARGRWCDGRARQRLAVWFMGSGGLGGLRSVHGVSSHWMVGTGVSSSGVMRPDGPTPSSPRGMAPASPTRTRSRCCRRRRPGHVRLDPPAPSRHAASDGRDAGSAESGAGTLNL